MFSTEGPVIIKGDVNGDGLEDFILGGARDDPDKLFLQGRGGWQSASVNWNELAGEDSRFETTCGAIFDADGDGDNDILLGAGGNEFMQGREGFMLRYYENDGTGRFTRNNDRLPPAFGNFSCICPDDMDNDGDVDLFIGARVVPGNYGLVPRSFLLKNDGAGNWVDVTRKELGTAGMVTDAVWSDVDNDGYKDLVIAGEWMQVKIFKSMGGSLNYSGFLSDQIPRGWWTTIEAADLDEDGDDDYVVGNWGLNSKFKASAERPLTMYVKDFDNNGKSEFIINWYAPLDSRAFPFAGKEEMMQQIPTLKNSNKTYVDYANKTYETLLSEDFRKNAIPYSATFMESSVIWNLGDTLKTEPLPLEAQVSPVFAILAEDLDGDGQKDLWLGGNFYGVKPEVGYYNSSRGVFLKGNSGSFTYISPAKTGIEVPGEVRDVTTLRGSDNLIILVARNNNSAVTFERKDQ